MKTSKTSGNRTIVAVAAVMTALLAVVIGRMIHINVSAGDRYSQLVLSQAESSATTISAKRGDIIDSNGITLATSTKVYNLILDPKVILSNQDKYLESTIAAVEEYFGIPASQTRDLVLKNPERHYIIIDEELTYAEIEDFIELRDSTPNITGIYTEEKYKRNYTFNTLACSVLGFMDGDTGSYGLEKQYEKELRGTDGRVYTYVSSDNVVETVRKEEEPGCTLKLTIDSNIQSIVEKQTRGFYNDYPYKSAAVIVQDPNTGAILAMADSGTFNCNSPRDLTASYTEEEILAMTDEEYSDILNERWKNFCVTETYEPGSTFKPFTLCAGISENRVLRDDIYDCNGSKTYYDVTINCHFKQGHGKLDTQHALANSCNVAFMEMAEKIGTENFTKYQDLFGFGQYTGIDLPNEASCASLLYDENMSPVDLATNSFGQNFNVTMIQMSTAFCSVINGGNLYRPYVVSGVYNDDGELVSSNAKTLVKKTISEETSAYLKQCLRDVVLEGTGDLAAVDGYVIAGKTGTAEKIGREEGIYLASFMGFAPFENPQVVCYAVLDEPAAGDQHGVSSQLFARVMSEVLPYLGVDTYEEDYDPLAYLLEPEEESTEENTGN